MNVHRCIHSHCYSRRQAVHHLCIPNYPVWDVYSLDTHKCPIDMLYYHQCNYLLVCRNRLILYWNREYMNCVIQFEKWNFISQTEMNKINFFSVIVHNTYWRSYSTLCRVAHNVFPPDIDRNYSNIVLLCSAYACIAHRIYTLRLYWKPLKCITKDFFCILLFCSLPFQFSNIVFTFVTLSLLILGYYHVTILANAETIVSWFGIMLTKCIDWTVTVGFAGITAS